MQGGALGGIVGKRKNRNGDKMMNDKLEYRAYTGSVEYLEKEQLYRGKLVGIEDHVSYEGKSEEELAEDFQAAVDIYILLCRDAGKKPEKISSAN